MTSHAQVANLIERAITRGKQTNHELAMERVSEMPPHAPPRQLVPPPATSVAFLGLTMTIYIAVRKQTKLLCRIQGYWRPATRPKI